MPEGSFQVPEKKAVAWLGRSQLYTMAALATHGEDTTLALSIDKFDPATGAATVAVQVRDTAVDTRKNHRHANGFAYYHVNRDGVAKMLKEGEV
jgi:hypothetical protein